MGPYWHYRNKSGLIDLEFNAKNTVRRLSLAGRVVKCAGSGAELCIMSALVIFKSTDARLSIKKEDCFTIIGLINGQGDDARLPGRLSPWRCGAEDALSILFM